MSLFLDFEGYHFPGVSFVIKEIAILNSFDADKCYNNFITGPRSVSVYDYKTLDYQYQMHKLRWEFGDYEFNEAMMDIARKLRSDTVFIKGNESSSSYVKFFLHQTLWR